MSNSELCTLYLKSPMGFLKVVVSESEIFSIQWTEKPQETRFELPDRFEGLFNGIRSQFEEYWSGSRRVFSLPCNFHWASPFLRDVWQALMRIPYGTTCTYGDVARSVGRPGAARAVGTACARNPFVIVVPCHRVVRHDGSIGNYSAPGGSNLKEALINFERSNVRE
ncbi:methylated-DNA--[protein]-cysteine S-methyltransferase [Thermodesulforhabdus norvegica]|uniref:methylated-DNA--[protein]-cysteine S-methyltransferase n=1 Tax=Thermodesulforhabdus norvegica TaxID=39841 RepID=A0A1I4SCC9_9BACT|nr:methylated-DNA--[protein]-cysteine S-methyltransferase [Thermodesulforhabdus norvegica]SFM61990.1 methylated-DNA-[protein]-cysteine S-methyltransferase [Thermodesulforhabdus norvegica]